MCGTAVFLVGAAHACSRRQGQGSLCAAPGAQGLGFSILPVSGFLPCPGCQDLERHLWLLVTWWLGGSTQLCSGHRAAPSSPEPLCCQAPASSFAQLSTHPLGGQHQSVPPSPGSGRHYLLEVLVLTPQLRDQIAATPASFSQAWGSTPTAGRLMRAY